MIDIDLMKMCAPNVAPITLEKVIQVESGGNPLAVNVNVKIVNGEKVAFKSPIKIESKQDALTVAYMAINAGHSVDMGYMQVNSNNLKALGYSIEEMLDPCKNIAAGARILTAFYSNALSKYPSEQAALRASLSAYNTGDFNQGFLNGYLARYGVGKSIVNVPALNPYTESTTVFLHPQKKETDETMNNTTESKKQDLEVKPVNSVRIEPIVSQSVQDSNTPGVQIEHTAQQADENGAFHETALSEHEAWESNADLDDPDGTTVVFKQGK